MAGENHAGLHQAEHQQGQREQHAHQDAHLQFGRQREGQQEGDHGHHAVVPVGLPGVDHRPDLDQAGHRHDDDHRQRSLRQVVEQGRQQQQRNGHGQHRDHRGEAGNAPRVEVHRRARKRAGNRVGLEDGAEDIAHALADQFTVGVQALPGSCRHRLGDGNGFHETDQ